MATSILTHPDWETPAVLRARPDADRILCAGVLSGRWKPLSDRYWDTCVIKVPYKVEDRASRGTQRATENPAGPTSTPHDGSPS